MKLSQTLLEEFKQESVVTRKLLALVPMDKLDYKPHEKSMPLGRLSTHVAEIYGWWKECLIHDELDFAKGDFTPKVFHTNEELLNYFDDLLAKSIKILSEVSEEEFDKPWTMRQGEMIFFTMPKSQVVRTWCMNHLFHHRAQLGVYMRLLDIPIPGSYGPSADDQG
ncbi:MAG: DinB family protein [Chitinophagaceae bacterium]|nr:DinB family protein [Chitinophagaceae bacterium]